jgi:exodeoxyribonuclease V gamma subunit
MNASPSMSPIKPGFIVLHGNRSEDLAQTLMSWLALHPLQPLEEEVVLVQSSSMAEWFKMEMAQQTGVCSAARVELPGRFVWRAYRQILGADAVPRESPLDKLPMTWRFMQILPSLLTRPDFAPIARYLAGEEFAESTRLLQLASQLADLFDQYQNYRTDWLQAWAANQDVLISPKAQDQALAEDQLWQPALWRAVLDTLTPEQRSATRPDLHRQVLERLKDGEDFSGRLPRRLVIFGMSQIPNALLELLSALAPFCQVMLVVPNPCRFYWGDIMEGRDLFKVQRRRQPLRNDNFSAQLELEDMHMHAHPLLAAWGRQGRDFVRQLDAFDDAVATTQAFPQLKIDLFNEALETANTPMLARVQQRIRDLEPLSVKHEDAPLSAPDRSIVFHTAHSPLRELEVLHDQLLGLLAQPGLSPRDIVVMVPEVQSMAPAIRAVFGQYARSDKRYIPYGIADLSAKSSSPIIQSVEWILELPVHRCGLSELIDLLEVPAVAQRFGIEAEKLPQLTQWMTGSGIRWGLHEDHRKQLDLAECGEQNSAWFGLQRMLLGYAAGAMDDVPNAMGWGGTEPYLEVGGLDADLAGSLAHLLQTLSDWWQRTQQSSAPLVWREHAQWLLDALFKSTDETDTQALTALKEALSHWTRVCEQANFAQEVGLSALRLGWMDALQVPRLDQRFRAGGVTFCTLMPMRAIPFQVVCLLGMNDGDYPRRVPRSDFDLMGQTGMFRPGDRSRQHDDRQLMLEALLSARRVLYVSWTGHSVRNNSEQPPSVLVSQLRDYIASAWGDGAVNSRTTSHPLQPFSRQYFEKDSSLQTYAREWRDVHDNQHQGHQVSEDMMISSPDISAPLDQVRLTRFLRNPVKDFFKERLGVTFLNPEEEPGDTEVFAFNHLENYQLIQSQIQHWPAPSQCVGLHDQIADQLNVLQRAGSLPMQGLGELKKSELQGTLTAMANAWIAVGHEFPLSSKRIAVSYSHVGVMLRDWVDGICQNDVGERAWAMLEASKVTQKSGKTYVARPHKLLRPWLQSMLVAAIDQPLHGRVVGQDGQLHIRPMTKEQALQSLNTLFEVWLQGQQTPLPLPLKTALDLAKPSANEADMKDSAQTTYEGDSFNEELAEVRDMCLARIFPDFEALCARNAPNGMGVVDLSRWVYGPLLEWSAQHVTAIPYE